LSMKMISNGLIELFSERDVIIFRLSVLDSVQIYCQWKLVETFSLIFDFSAIRFSGVFNGFSGVFWNFWAKFGGYF
jgi:hypothetical protein